MKLKLNTLRSLIYGHLLVNYPMAITGMEDGDAITQSARSLLLSITDPSIEVSLECGKLDISFRYWAGKTLGWDCARIRIAEDGFWYSNRVRDELSSKKYPNLSYDDILEIIDTTMSELRII